MKFRNQRSYMGHSITNVNNKPILHKKGKRWVVVALSTLILAGFGGAMSANTTHADTTTATANSSVQTKKPAVPNNPNANGGKPAATGVHSITGQALNLHRNLMNTNAKRMQLGSVDGSAPAAPNPSASRPRLQLRDSAPTITPDPLKPASANEVAHGTWGTATWNLYDNHQLDLHDGNLTNSDNTFDGNQSNIQSIYTSRVKAPTDSSNLFASNGNGGRNFTNLNTIDLSGMDTHGTTSMSGMFHGDGHLEHIYFKSPVNNQTSFNTSDVTSMDAMFDDDWRIQSLDMSTFDTKNVTDFGGMFWNTPSLQALDLSNFNMRSANSVGSMFTMNEYGIWGEPGNGAPDEVNTPGRESHLDQLVLPSNSNTPSFNWLSTGLSNGVIDNTASGSTPTTNNGHQRLQKVVNNQLVGSPTNNWSDVARDPGNWINIDASKSYYIDYYDEGTDRTIVPSIMNTVKVIPGASYATFNGSVPEGYKLANGTTTSKLGTFQGMPTATFDIVKDDVIAHGMWGTEPWTLNNKGVMTVFGTPTGQLADHALPGDPGSYGELYYETGITPNDSNKVHKIVFTHNVKAPVYSGRLIDNEHYSDRYYTNLSDIDVGGLDTSNTNNFFAMFCGLSHLKHIENLPHMDMSNVSGDSNTWMFGADPNLRSVDLSNAKMSPTLGDGATFVGDNNLDKLTLGPNVTLDNGINLDGNGVTDLSNNYGLDQLENSEPHPGTWYVYQDAGTWGSANWYLLNSGRLLLINGTLTPSQNMPSQLNNDASKVNGIVTDNVIAPNNSSNLFKPFTNAYKYGADLRGLNFTSTDNVKQLLANNTHAKYNYSFDTALDNQETVDNSDDNQRVASLSTSDAQAVARASASASISASDVEHTADHYTDGRTTSLNGRLNTDEGSLDTAYTKASNAIRSLTSEDTRISANSNSAISFSNELAGLSTSANADKAAIINDESHIHTNSNNIGTLNGEIANNINRLNTAITNISRISNDINANTANINVNGHNIHTNAQHINTNGANIANNADNIDTNRSHIQTNSASASTAISHNADSIATNSQNISNNTANINTNSTSASNAIANNANNINTNSGNISANGSNINKNSASASNAIAHNAANINTNSGNISANGSNIAKNSTSASNAIAHNAANINTNSGNISANTSNINKNSTSASNAIAHNAANINTNSGNISANGSNIAKNSTSASNAIAHNAANINTNSGNISANTSNINKNSTSASNAIAHNANNIHTNSGNISANTSNINKNSTSASNAIAHNAANIHTDSENISANTSNINKNSASASTAISNNATNIINNSKADSKGISADSKAASTSASVVNSNDNSNAYSLANSATGVANNNAFGIDMEMNSDEQNVNSLSNTANINAASLADNISVLNASKQNKPKYNTFYINIMKPVWLHKGTRITKRTRAKKLNPGYTLRVKPANKSGLLEATVNGKRYFLGNYKKAVQKTYIQPNEIKRNEYIEVLRPMKEYRDPYFTRRSTIRTFKRGTILFIKRCKTITHTHMTRIQLTNGRWITSNRKYVTLRVLDRHDVLIQKTYIQPSELRSHKSYIKVIKPIEEYRSARFGRKAVRGFKRGSVLRIKRIKTLTRSHLTRLQLTNGRWITSNKHCVKLVRR